MVWRLVIHYLDLLAKALSNDLVKLLRCHISKFLWTPAPKFSRDVFHLKSNFPYTHPGTPTPKKDASETVLLTFPSTLSGRILLECYFSGSIRGPLNGLYHCDFGGIAGASTHFEPVYARYAAWWNMKPDGDLWASERLHFCKETPFFLKHFPTRSGILLLKKNTADQHFCSWCVSETPRGFTTMVFRSFPASMSLLPKRTSKSPSQLPAFWPFLGVEVMKKVRVGGLVQSVRVSKPVRTEFHWWLCSVLERIHHSRYYS